ncbi:MAG: hypothetical protein IPP90_04980 [Gemmatimonadaceae bacterium]|nr:hypothetical protein [Gemmatimonadaceae bacterium]
MTLSSDGPALTLPSQVAMLLDAVTAWSSQRWRAALCTAREPLHRARRDTSRALCDAVLAADHQHLQYWLVRDAVRTSMALSLASGSALNDVLAVELLEDAALAVLARPALPLMDLAVLLGPCLPLFGTEGSNEPDP